MHAIRIVVASVSLVLVVALAWGRSYVVIQKDKAFDTEKVVIRPGDKVVFQNHDEFTHNIYSPTKNNEFNINVQRPGGSTGVTFWTEGEVEIRCAIHPKMKMTVVIKR